MEKFRKIWDAEKDAWLLAHKEMQREERYFAFLAAFPNADVTKTGFYGHCSSIGATSYKARGKHLSRPLYSEQEKKGYVRIKIAEPNVWIQKQKWVYMETHPWEDFSEFSEYIFLEREYYRRKKEQAEKEPSEKL